MIKWIKAEAGHYYVHGQNRAAHKWFRIDIRLIDRDWHLSVNDIFRGRFGTARYAKARAQHLVDTNDFSLNQIGD